MYNFCPINYVFLSDSSRKCNFMKVIIFYKSYGQGFKNQNSSITFQEAHLYMSHLAPLPSCVISNTVKCS